jgi:hypothetical protein
MAQAIAARAAQRGFPVFDFSGQTGQGALQDATAPPPSAGLPTGGWTDPNQDPGGIPAQLPPPEAYVLPALLWGLPGSPNPDDTPTNHAAPFADPALLAIGIDEGTHGPVFDGVALRDPRSGQSDVGTLAQMDQGRNQGHGSTADTLQPLTGQIRSQAGFDAVQGYGGGGPGPGGVNEPQGPTTDQMVFGGYTYSNLIVNAAEVPFLSADSAQFIATDPALPLYMPTYDGATTAVLAQQVIGADVPAQGPAVPMAPLYSNLPWG